MHTEGECLLLQEKVLSEQPNSAGGYKTDGCAYGYLTTQILFQAQDALCIKIEFPLLCLCSGFEGTFYLFLFSQSCVPRSLYLQQKYLHIQGGTVGSSPSGHVNVSGFTRLTCLPCWQVEVLEQVTLSCCFLLHLFLSVK